MPTLAAMDSATAPEGCAQNDGLRLCQQLTAVSFRLPVRFRQKLRILRLTAARRMTLGGCVISTGLYLEAQQKVSNADSVASSRQQDGLWCDPREHFCSAGPAHQLQLAAG